MTQYVCVCMCFFVFVRMCVCVCVYVCVCVGGGGDVRVREIDQVCIYSCVSSYVCMSIIKRIWPWCESLSLVFRLPVDVKHHVYLLTLLPVLKLITGESLYSAGHFAMVHGT